MLAGTERRTSGESSLFDRFLDDVIQDTPCPLLIVTSPDDQGAWLDHVSGGHILVPISGSDADRTAAEVAFTIAAGTDMVVDLIHVVSGPQHMVRVNGDRAVLHAVDIGEDMVAKIAELGRSMDAQVRADVLVADHPERAIVERAQRGTHLVVFASSRRPVTQRAFFGHRIDHIVGHTPCPVVVVAR